MKYKEFIRILNERGLNPKLIKFSYTSSLKRQLKKVSDNEISFCFNSYLRVGFSKIEPTIVLYQDEIEKLSFLILSRVHLPLTQISLENVTAIQTVKEPDFPNDEWRIEISTDKQNLELLGEGGYTPVKILLDELEEQRKSLIGKSSTNDTESHRRPNIEEKEVLAKDAVTSIDDVKTSDKNGKETQKPTEVFEPKQNTQVIFPDDQVLELGKHEKSPEDVLNEVLNKTPDDMLNEVKKRSEKTNLDKDNQLEKHDDSLPDMVNVGDSKIKINHLKQMDIEGRSIDNLMPEMVDMSVIDLLRLRRAIKIEYQQSKRTLQDYQIGTIAIEKTLEYKRSQHQ